MESPARAGESAKRVVLKLVEGHGREHHYAVLASLKLQGPSKFSTSALEVARAPVLPHL